ncbi:curli assembly protein CsgF [Pseudomonas sp. LS1212]|uniref:curli assembly protein CsgF n=1 Tax=Pseudomonas sp. LS1212 TaxID=2972478 RepID=UPI00215B835A|nr:curli assembly protein CsgF [Pseudomonas sp. LS1212]UVJ46523.1 curli assembly protein CsgF [Pseudomonas sp. LS1212]
MIPSLSISLASGLLLAGAVNATELVYTPVNPSFGGNPLNGTWLLNNAQSQNDHDDPDLESRSSLAGTTAFERFTSQLESRLLSQLLTNIQNGNTGSLQTDAFLIEIVDVDGVLTIVVSNKATGETSEIVVDGLRFN